MARLGGSSELRPLFSDMRILEGRTENIFKGLNVS
jgi:hypothetical protein